MTARYDDVTICSEPGCARAARFFEWCIDHAPPPPPRPKREWAPRVSTVPDFTPEEYAELRARVAADAAPLFLMAVQFLVGQQVQSMADEMASLGTGDAA